MGVSAGAGKGIISLTWVALSLYGQRFLYAALCSMRGHVGYGVIYPRFPPPQLRRYVCAAAFRSALRLKPGAGKAYHLPDEYLP